MAEEIFADYRLDAGNNIGVFTDTDSPWLAENAHTLKKINDDRAQSATALEQQGYIPRLAISNLESTKKVYSADARYSTDSVAMSDETLRKTASQLQQSIARGDKDAVWNLIQACPRQNRAMLEREYERQTRHSLRSELKSYGMENVVRALDSKNSSQDTANNITDNLGKLAKLHPWSSERAQIEKELRDSVRTLNSDQLKQLDAELRGLGKKGLKEIVNESSLSRETKQVVDIYLKGCENLTAADRARVAEIATNAAADRNRYTFNHGARDNSPDRLYEWHRSNSLEMLSEALSGEQGQEARKIFRQTGAYHRLDAGLNGKDLKTAGDIVAFGSDVPTRIANYSSSTVGAEKGLENVICHMSEREREMFKRGEHLASGKSSRFDNPGDQESYEFYQRVHKALYDSTFVWTNPARYTESARFAKLVQLEDLAANGSPTLISRIAAARNEMTPDDSARILTAIHNGTAKDYELMHNDPVYKAKVDKLISTLNYNDRLLANREINRIYMQPANTKEFSQGEKLHLEDLNRSYGLKKADDATVMRTIAKSKASDWASMDQQDRNLLEQRITRMPDGPRQATEKMIAQLKAGRSPNLGLEGEFYLDQLQRKNPMAMAHRLQEAQKKDPELCKRLKGGQEPELEKAIKSAMGQSYGKYGQELIERGGLSLETIMQGNTELIGAGGKTGPRTRLDVAGVYKDISLLSAEDRKRITVAHQKECGNDSEAKAFLAKTFIGLSAEQRNIAIGIAGNADGKPTLADRMRASVNGDDKNMSSAIEELETMSQKQKIEAIQEYSRKYGSFMITDVSKAGTSAEQARLSRALPLSVDDLYREHQRALKGASTGLYDHSNMKSQSKRLTEGYRDYNSAPGLRGKEQEIQKILNDSSLAVSDHEEAKREYAAKVSEKIMDAAALAVPVGGLSLKAVLYGAGVGAALRPSLESAITGVRPEGAQLAGMLGAGAIDGSLLILGPEHVAIAGKLTTRTMACLPERLASTAARDALSKPALDRMESVLKEKMEAALKAGKDGIPRHELESVVAKEVSDPEMRKIVVDQLEAESHQQALREAKQQAEQQLMSARTPFSINKTIDEAELATALPKVTDSVGVNRINSHAGRTNCTACVGATLRSAKEGHLKDVGDIYNLKLGSHTLGEPVPGSFKKEADAITYMERASGTKLTPYRTRDLPEQYPDLNRLPAGHYAVTFNIGEVGERHVIYAQKGSDGSMRFFDPQNNKAYPSELVRQIMEERKSSFYKAEGIPGVPDCPKGDKTVTREQYSDWLKPKSKPVDADALCDAKIWNSLDKNQKDAMKEMNELRKSGTLRDMTEDQFIGLSIRWAHARNQPNADIRRLCQQLKMMR